MTPSSSYVLHLPHEAASQALGSYLAAWLRPGDGVLLFGDLGAGKSTLARALVRAMTTPDEEVPSPTFTLVQTYEGQTTDGAPILVTHSDLYRLKTPDEVASLGLDEALADGVLLVEWPERMGRIGWRHCLKIWLSTDQDQGRLARLEGTGRFMDPAFGPRWDQLLSRMNEEFHGVG